MKSKNNPFAAAARAHSLAITLSCGVAALATSQPAFAATRTWSGATGVNWSSAGNWSALPVAGDVLTFAGTTNTATNNDLTADTMFAGINFTNTVNGQSFSLAGNRITLGGNIVTTAMPASPATSTITDTISMAMILDATRTITTNTRHNLNIFGVISESSSGFGITKAGTATLTLTGANTFSGLVTLNGGFLNVNSIADSGSSALGFGALNLTAGQLTYTGDTPTSTNRTITLAGSATINTAASGTTAATSTLTLNGTFTTGNGGAKTVTFAGGNTGANTVSSLLANATDGSVLTVTKNGSGNWALTNANNSFTGALLLNQGTLTVNSIADDGVASNIGAGSSIRFGNAASSGTMIYTGAAQSTNRTVQIGNNSTSPAATETGGGTIQNDGSGLLTFSAPTFNTPLDTASGTGANRVLTLRGSNDGKISGIIQNNTNSGGAGTTTIGITKADAGTWTLEGANTYSGPTNVTGGTLTISGSRNVAAGAITVGGAATTSVLNLQNTGSYSTGQIIIGNQGSTSTINQSAGTITGVGGSGIIMGNGSVANNSTYALSGGSLTSQIIMGTNTSTGAPHVTNFNLSGSGTLTASNLRIGRYSTTGAFNSDNTFAQTGGTATVTNLGLGGNTADAASTNPIIARLNLTGGTFSATTFESLSAGGANTSTITIGGSAQVTLPAFPITRGSGSTATITFDTTVGGGGFLAPQVASTTYMPSGTFNNAYLSANGANFSVASGKDITIGQVLEDKTGEAGRLTKSDAGQLTLTGVNTYTGATLISGGTLAVNGSISTSLLTTVDSGGTLSGTGTIGTATVSAGGILAPGNSIGTLNFSNTLSLAGISNFEIDPTLGLGLNADRANVTNGISYGGILNVLYAGDSSNFTSGMVFNLFDASSFSNSFSAVNLPSLPEGLSWQNDLATNGSLAVIPEPDAAMLVGSLGVFALLRRRRA